MPQSMRAIVLLTVLATGLAGLLYAGWHSRPTAAQAPTPTEATMTDSAPNPRAQKTDDEWRAHLTPEQYHVTRQQGTERPFTGEYWDHKEDGLYYCIGCGEVLFDSATKFDSGCGWPSFYEIAENANVGTSVDNSHFMTRIEVHCNHCGAHLGHVFPDGPQPTGQRYCINSASLQFQDRAETDSANSEDSASE